MYLCTVKITQIIFFLTSNWLYMDFDNYADGYINSLRTLPCRNGGQYMRWRTRGVWLKICTFLSHCPSFIRRRVLGLLDPSAYQSPYIQPELSGLICMWYLLKHKSSKDHHKDRSGAGLGEGQLGSCPGPFSVEILNLLLTTVHWLSNDYCLSHLFCLRTIFVFYLIIKFFATTSHTSSILYPTSNMSYRDFKREVYVHSRYIRF